MLRRAGILFVIALGLAGAGWSEGALLATGQPPLTRDLVGRFGGFLQWALDVRFTSQDWAALEAFLVGVWNEGSPEDIEGVLVTTAQYEQQVVPLPQVQRHLARVQATPSLLAQLAIDPSDPFSRWATALHARAHPPIAMGFPPLTREAAEAYVDVSCFVLAEVTGRAFEPSPALRQEWVQEIAASYPLLPPDQRHAIAQMHVASAVFRVHWPSLAPRAKAQLRAEWAAAFEPQPGPAWSAPSGAGGASPQHDLSRELEMSQIRSTQFNNMMSSMAVGHLNLTTTMSNAPYQYQLR